ncbi:MAG: hypothetical protein FK734_00250 [Asgard group archaeon]|nr:hypothetical protein [Asgard group archaeon]
MDTQIIISREDNTDFISLGYIQTDTSLVSALGGALANFAEEIGLAGNQATQASTKNNTINFSRFQNGVLASKIVPVGEHNPIVLIAVRGFEGEDKELDVIIDYATLLAQAIVKKCEKEYSSIGIVPVIEDVYDTVIQVANQISKKSSDKLKQFVKTIKPKISTILDELWQNQDEFESWSRSYSTKKLSTLSQSEVESEIARYFYLQGVKTDALFPLEFSSMSDPLVELTKIVSYFLNKKASIARKEIVNEITKIYTQLKDSSKALLNREQFEIPAVEIINESYLFEKILVAKSNDLEKVANELISTTNKDLYKKLFQKYPLKFIAMSKESTFNLDELNNIVNNTMQTILKVELAEKEWMSSKTITILQNIISKYNPSNVMKNRAEILEKTNTEFINSLKKDHPFIILADPNLSKTNAILNIESEKLLERYKTSLDEAVILFNLIGQIQTTLTTDNSSSTQDVMILYFLQNVIQPYQFRDVPDIVYRLIAESLEKTALGKKGGAEDIVKDSIQDLEQLLDFKILPDTKKSILRRISKAKPSIERFETFENLAYFFTSFREALELTLAKIFQTIFGTEKIPNPPIEMTRIIEDITSRLQNFYILYQMIDKIVKRPNGRDLFSENNVKFIAKHTKFKQTFPTPLEYAKIAYEQGFLKPVKEKKQAKITKAELKDMEVKISSLKLEGQVETLLKNPLVIQALWAKYTVPLLEARQKLIKKAIADHEKQSKVSAGGTSGKVKFGKIIKQLRDNSRWLTNVVSGGGFMRKFFTGSKDLNQMLNDLPKSLYNEFNYHPDNLQSNGLKELPVSLNTIIPSGDFQELMIIYASLWVADSAYIDKIAADIFWDGIMKKATDSLNGSTILEKKINQNLKTEFKKNRDQKSVIRRAIVEEIVPIFNQIIRATLSSKFTIFKDKRIVKFDEKTDDWYVSYGSCAIPLATLKNIFNFDFAKFSKGKDDLNEVRVALTDYYSLKRYKDPQTLEEFIRKATFNLLNKKEIKALEFFGELNEKYIGKSASDTFYSYIRSLAQMIITTVE